MICASWLGLVDAALPQHATQLSEQRIQAAVDMKRRRQADEPGDFAGGEVVVKTQLEQQAIRRVLQATNGNKSEAARQLRTDYKTLHLKMKQYGIEAPRFRESRAP